MITGINHITLSVCDLEKSFKFYTEILGCQAIAKRLFEKWLAVILGTERSPLAPLFKGGTGIKVPLFKGDLGGSKSI
jgi:catechol 2,3-dioxygenase-like lactoylglutathione lyase family enzyme